MEARVAETRLFFHDTTSRPLGSVTMAGQIVKESGAWNKMRVFGSYAIVYLVAGQGRYQDGRGVRAKLKAGDCILIFPELPHRYGPGRGERWEEIYLCFQGPLFETWRRERIIDPSRPLHHAEPIAVWYNRLKQFAEKPRPAGPAEQLEQLGELTQLLSGLISPIAEDTGESEWLSLAKSVISSNLEVELEWSQVAAGMGMSYERFRKAFAAQVGMPPAKYRSVCRIDAAKVLLLRQELTLAAVARSLGFHDEFHFSKRFKEMVGMAPREWRRNQALTKLARAEATFD